MTNHPMEWSHPDYRHPLTDEIIEEIAEDVFYYEYSIPIFRQDMRTAYDKGRDDQLEQVMKWLDENLSNYTDDDYLGDCEPLYKLEGDLKEAMRPQEDN